jgi:hypothetical protein
LKPHAQKNGSEGNQQGVEIAQGEGRNQEGDPGINNLYDWLFPFSQRPSEAFVAPSRASLWQTPILSSFPPVARLLLNAAPLSLEELPSIFGFSIPVVFRPSFTPVFYGMRS